MSAANLPLNTFCKMEKLIVDPPPPHTHTQYPLPIKRRESILLQYSTVQQLLGKVMTLYTCVQSCMCTLALYLHCIMYLPGPPRALSLPFLLPPLFFIPVQGDGDIPTYKSSYVQRWKQIRSQWRKASALNQARYTDSLKVLREMFQR
jgi:hypothetical protein